MREGDPRGIELYLEWPEQGSLWAVVERQRQDFPIVWAFAGDQYGPEGEFRLEAGGIVLFLGEIDQLEAALSGGIAKEEARRRLDEWVEQARRPEQHTITEGISLDAARSALKRTREFLNEAMRREWIVYGETD